MACKAVLTCSICLSVLCFIQHLIELHVNLQFVHNNSVLASFKKHVRSAVFQRKLCMSDDPPSRHSTADRFISRNVACSIA